MLENMRISIQGIWSHKMRSFLTMLGIIIGIASIIAIVSTIKGTSEQIKEDLIGSGNNTVTISLYSGDSGYDPMFGMTDGGKPPLLTKEQKEEVMDMEHVENATFSIQALTAVYIIRILLCREVRYTELMKIIWIPADIWYDPEEDLFRRITTI